MKDGEIITLDDLKVEATDMLNQNILMQLNHGLIDADEYLEKMTEVEDIQNMTAEEFYAWWNLVREVVKP